MFYRSLTENHNPRLQRARPVIALASVAFAVGAIVGANHAESKAHDLAARFVAGWARGDYATMYSEIDASSQRSVTADEFLSAYRHALTTATVSSVRVTGKPRDVPGGLVAVPVRVHTRLFGTLSTEFDMKIQGEGGEGLRVAWSPSLAFPGLHEGETLNRRTTLPRRARATTLRGGLRRLRPGSSCRTP